MTDDGEPLGHGSLQDEALQDDALQELGARLESLGDRPVAEHPAVLDELHRAVVAELDDLAAGARPPGDG